MSTISLVIPADFALVGLSLGSYVVLNLYQQHLVSAARRKYGVSYPNMYATDAEAKADPKKLKFNCVQRAHQNTLENVPFMISLTVFFGLYHPRLSTIFAHLWILSKFGYTAGYASGVPRKRTNPISVLQYPAIAGLLFGSIYVGFVHAKAAFF